VGSGDRFSFLDVFSQPEGKGLGLAEYAHQPQGLVLLKTTPRTIEGGQSKAEDSP